MTQRSFWIIGIVLLAALFIPISQYRVVSYGIDSYDTHLPLFTGHTARQQFTTDSKTTAIGAILVNLHRAPELSDVHVQITNSSTQAILDEGTISVKNIHDDSFAYFSVKVIPAHTPITVTYSAPDATAKNAIGIRFGNTPKELSLALQETVPVWKAFITVAHNRPLDWLYGSIALAASLLLAIFIWIPTTKGRLAWGAVALVSASAFGAALFVIPQFGGVSGGDAFNYLSITQSLSHFENPFLNSKRLPGFPLLLVPTFVTGSFDDEMTMRIICAVAGIIGLILTALIAKELTNSWTVSIAAATILGFQKDYFWTAMRPEPYAVYTALLLAGVYLFITGYKKSSYWKNIAFGLVLGYAAMTRQEGFVLALVFGGLSLVYEIAKGRNIWRLLRMYLPALAVISPFLITNSIQYHNPFYTQYLEGDRLQIVDSYLAFQDAVGATWGIVGSMWKTSWDQLERLSLTSIPLIAGVIGMWAWYVYARFVLPKRFQTATGAVLLIAAIGILLTSIYAKGDMSGTFTKITAGFVLASIPLFLIETKWKGVAIALVVVSQVGIATWFHPFPKHYEQSYPIIVLMMTVALLSRTSTTRFVSGSALAVTVLPFLLIAGMLGQKLNTAIDKQNQDTALDSVTYRAARYARGLPTPIGFDQAYLPARLYFDPVAKYFPDEESPTQQMEDDWLSKNPLKTIIVSNGNNVFKTPRPNWKELTTFKAAGNDDKIFISTVYSVE